MRAVTTRSRKAGEPEIKKEQILAVGEDVLRRFGPQKATVVDVARIMGVSHGSLYRHFESKSELWNAVVEIWLGRMSAELREVAENRVDAPALRIRRWFDTMRELKTTRFQKEAEMFAAFHELAHEVERAVAGYYQDLRAQLADILDEGQRDGSFDIRVPSETASALLGATTRFHHPWHAGEWHLPDIDNDFEAVWQLLERGFVRR